MSSPLPRVLRDWLKEHKLSGQDDEVRVLGQGAGVFSQKAGSRACRAVRPEFPGRMSDG